MFSNSFHNGFQRFSQFSYVSILLFCIPYILHSSQFFFLFPRGEPRGLLLGNAPPSSLPFGGVRRRGHCPAAIRGARARLSTLRTVFRFVRVGQRRRMACRVLLRRMRLSVPVGSLSGQARKQIYILWVSLPLIKTKL